MSRLVSGLKSGVNFGGGINIFVPKKLNNDSRIRDLQHFYKTKNLSSIIKSSILFFIYENIDIDNDLYNQIRYDNHVIEFVKYQKQIEETITLKEFKLNFIEIVVHKWHVIFCLSRIFRDYHYQNSNNNLDFLEAIIDFNVRRLDLYTNNREKKYTIEVNSLDKIELRLLKTLHGTSNISTLLKRCILFYIHSNSGSGYKNNHLKLRGNSIHLEQLNKHDSNKLYKIVLPYSVENMLDFDEDNINDITSIINFNIKVYYNLFPEQR